MNDVMNKLLKVASELDNAGEFELANELDDLIFEMSKDAGILWTGESSDDKNSSNDEAEDVDSDVEKALDILCERISEKELCDLPKAVWLEALELCIDSCEDMKKEAGSNFMNWTDQDLIDAWEQYGRAQQAPYYRDYPRRALLQELQNRNIVIDDGNRQPIKRPRGTGWDAEPDEMNLDYMHSWGLGGPEFRKIKPDLP